MTRAALLDAVWILLGIVPSLGLVLWIIDAEHGLALTSLGSTAILLFCFPLHEGSRPVAVLVSHLLGAAIGIALLQLFGSNVWTMGLGVALIAVVMKMLNIMHPPAGGCMMFSIFMTTAISATPRPIVQTLLPNSCRSAMPMAAPSRCETSTATGRDPS